MANYICGVNLAVAIALLGCLMSGNCYICPNDCVACTGDNKCSSCSNPGYYVYTHACVKCPENCVSCTSNTECTNCTKGFYGNNKCLQECSYKCKDKECDINGRCKSCEDGAYGDTCNIKCGQNCTRCDRSTGGCLSCETGTYLYNYQCKHCKTPCTQCTSSSCTKCVVGHWGVNCEKECSGCQHCIKSNGYCSVCVDGMSHRLCNIPCSSKCLSCERFFYFKCRACVASTYGHNSNENYYDCYRECSQNCLNSTCDDKTGECTFGCIEGYYGNKCKCPQNCNCDNSENCISCKEGFGNVYKNCECTNEKCVDNDCSACTSLNYFVHDKTCCSCRVQDANCEECTTHVNGSFGKCTKCRRGFVSSSKQNECTKCPISCKFSRCDPISGECTLGCMAGYWGTTCDNTCAHSCLKCDQHSGICTVCKPGNYSRDCSKSCSQSCKTIDNVLKCAILDGACFNGCQSTKVHGSHCQHSCSINCTYEHCDWQTAHCLHGCSDHHYGDECKHTCSLTCSTPKTGSRCYDTNGSCVYGCEVGYYGKMCENQCSPNCANTTCEQFTGSCIHGCSGPYEGNSCLIALSQAGVITGTIAGGLGGSIVLCLVVLVFVALVWRRRHYKDVTGSPQEMATYDIQQGVDAEYTENKYGIEEMNDDHGEVVNEQIDAETNVQPDNTSDKIEANEIVKYEEIDGETNLQEAGSDVEHFPIDGEVAGRYI